MKKAVCFVLCLAVSVSIAGCGGSAQKGPSLNQSQGVNDVLEAGMAAAESEEKFVLTSPEPLEGTSGSGETESGSGESGSTEGSVGASAEGSAGANAEGSTQGITGGTGAGGSENGTASPGEGGAQADAGSAGSDTAASTGSSGKEPASGQIDVDLTVLSSTMVYSEVSSMVNTPESYIGKTVKMDGLFSSYHDEETDKYYYACIIQDATACCAQGIEFVLTDDYSYPEDYPEEGGEICVVGTFDTYQEGDYTYCTLRNARLV